MFHHLKGIYSEEVGKILTVFVQADELLQYTLMCTLPKHKRWFNNEMTLL